MLATPLNDMVNLSQGIQFNSNFQALNNRFISEFLTCTQIIHAPCVCPSERQPFSWFSRFISFTQSLPYSLLWLPQGRFSLAL
jgi:hypothetical protein